MKIGLELLPGKRIKAVVFAKDRRGPRMRVFLTFEDGTTFEFYGVDFAWSTFLEDAMGILWYVETGECEIVCAHANPEPREMPLEELLSDRPRIEPYRSAGDKAPMFSTRRELEAWEVAKSVIGKAKGG